MINKFVIYMINFKLASMKRKKRIIILIVIVFAVLLLVYVIFNRLLNRNRLAGLKINSNEDVPIFVDNEQVGTRLYDGTRKPGKVNIKIGDYETRVDLAPQIKTIINRNFYNAGSYGETLSFDETGLSSTSLAVISKPIGASVFVDNKFYGLTPLDVNDLIEGKHKLDVLIDGYDNDSFFINLANKYKLTAFVDLQIKALQSQSQNSPKEDKTEVFIKILSTPNGFLRVRRDPGIVSTEIGKVHDGEKYKFLDQDKQTGWFKIQFDASWSGWISDTYAAKFN